MTHLDQTRPAAVEAAADVVDVHRVGPAGTLAADSQFGVALTSLWHGVSQAGGAVGFVPSATRAQVAAQAAPVVAQVRVGRTVGIALIAVRELIGFGALVLGSGLQAHTGSLSRLMIDPAWQGSGLGTRLMIQILGVGTDVGLDRVEISIPGGYGLEQFVQKFGFVQAGRRVGWIREPGAQDRDEILLAAVLKTPGT